MQFKIKNRWTGAVIYTAELSAEYESASDGVKLGGAIKIAVKSRANLAGANLAGANLAGVNLARANLTGAYLADANLAGANLGDANLADANLADAYLGGAYLGGVNLADANLADAYLGGANLADAYLGGAYLGGVNLADANLGGANLAGANLAGVNLAGANLAGAKWRNGVVIQRAPLQLFGLRYPVTIIDDHMEIECELHPLAEWAAFDDDRIIQMDGKDALKFWRSHKEGLLAIARGDGRGVTVEAGK